MPYKIVDRETLKKYRQKYDKRLEDGTLVVNKSKTTEQIQNVSKESGDTQTTPFVFQATATNDNVGSTSTAPVFQHLQIRGNSVKFKQYVNKALLSTNINKETGWTLSYDSATGTFRLTGTMASQGYTYFYLNNTNIFAPQSNHRYYMSIKVKDNNNNITYVWAKSNNAGATVSKAYTGAGLYEYISETGTVSGDNVAMFGVSAPNGSSIDVEFTNEIMIIDLTDIELTRERTYATAQEFSNDYRLPYYDYSATSKIINASSNKLILTEYNQFNALDTDIEVVGGSWYRLVRWNGTELVNITSGSVNEYDGAKNLIKTTAYGDLVVLYSNDSDYKPNDGLKGLKLEPNTHYVQITGASQTNILFNIAWDGSRNDYAPFFSREYDLPTMVRPYSVSKDFFNYVDPNGLETDVVDRIKLKDLDWNYNSSYAYPYFYATINTKKIPTANALIYIMSNANYTIGGAVGVSYFRTNDLNKVMLERRDYNEILAQDTTYNDATSFKNHFGDDDYIYFVLAIPITTQLDSYVENVSGGDWGTMKFVSTETESSSNPIVPQGNKFFYPADYVLLIDDLGNYCEYDVNNLALKEDVNAIDTKYDNLYAIMKANLGGVLRHQLTADFDNTVAIDLNSLEYGNVGNENSVATTSLSTLIKKPTSDDNVANIVCNLYKTVSRNNLFNVDKSICVNTGGALIIYDTSLAGKTGSEVKATLKDILLAYEKAS